MAKIPEVKFNVNRLYHLMSLFALTEGDILDYLNSGLTRKLGADSIFGNVIKLSNLKKIDKIFDRGLSYYIDPSDPVKSEKESIFFRKSNFNGDIKLAAKLLVAKYEKIKVSFDTAAILSGQRFKRQVPSYTIAEDAKKIAIDLRQQINLGEEKNVRNFLKNFIESLSEFDILVLEHVESPVKKDKVNVEGFFIKPNTIVIKRNPISYKREIFTLAHELAHYLLDIEEIDEDTWTEGIYADKENDVETWCNEFAFCFLAGEYIHKIDRLGLASSRNDYHHDVVRQVSAMTHLSELAIYTRMFWNGTISAANYRSIQEAFREEFEKIQAERKLELERQKKRAEEQGKELFIPPPKPIVSPMYSNTLKRALYEGVIEEMDFCQRLNIKPENIEEYLYESNY